jgi:hypothetical protein
MTGLSRWLRWPRVLAVGVLCGALALVVAAVVIDLRRGGPGDPGRVTTQVTQCDLGSYGAAQVAFQVRNGDRDLHTYKIEIWVKSGDTPVGYTESEVNDVGPGVTTSGRVLIPVTAGASDARCSASATVFDGRPGHRHQ